MMNTAGSKTRTATSSIRSLIGSGVVAAAAASVATMTVAAVGHAAGISLDLRGAPLPVITFVLLTAVFLLVGMVLAVVLADNAEEVAAEAFATAVERWPDDGLPANPGA